MMYLAEDTGDVDRDYFLEPIKNMVKFFDALPSNVTAENYYRSINPPTFLGSELTSGFLKVLNEVLNVFDDFGNF